MTTIRKHSPDNPEPVAAMNKYGDRVKAVDEMRQEMARLMTGAHLDDKTVGLRARLVALLVGAMSATTDTSIQTIVAGIGTALQYPLMAREADATLTANELAVIASDALAISLGIKTSFIEGDPDDVLFPDNVEAEVLTKLEAMERVFPKALANIKAGLHQQPIVTDSDAPVA